MLGERLRRLRTQKKLTQTEFANKIGITRGTYAHYEINKRQPDYETLVKIAEFYNVSTDYLLGATDNPAPTPKDQKLKEFLERPGVPYDDETYLSDEQVKLLRNLLEQVVERPAYKETAKQVKQERENEK